MFFVIRLIQIINRNLEERVHYLIERKGRKNVSDIVC